MKPFVKAWKAVTVKGHLFFSPGPDQGQGAPK